MGMMRSILTVYVLALSTSICAAQSASSGDGTRSETLAPASSPSNADPIAPSGRWDVAQAPCSAIVRESDDDRAIIGMFYYGYIAAKLNFTVIDTTRIEGDLRHVFETCKNHPEMTIVDAFETLRQRQ
jgi:hypothetical protein